MKKVLVNFIQDRSGSMQSVWAETLSGFKTFVKDLQDKSKDNGVKDEDIEYLFSLTTFDTQVETPIIAKPIAEVSQDELVKHGPRGSTALYDAVGATITNTETNRHGAEKIIVVVVTDGHENSSREWDKDRLHTAIEAKLTAGDWTFTYLGTQPETWGDAAAIGVGVGSVASYVGQHANAAYAATSHAVRGMSASADMGTRSLMMDYLAPEMEKAASMRVDRPTATQRPMPPVPTPRPAPGRKSTVGRRWK